MGGPGFDHRIGVGIGADGGSILVGQIAGGSISFPDGTQSFSPSGVAVTKFSSTGQYKWARAVPGADGVASDVAADGSIAVLGTFAGTVKFGSQAVTSTGFADVFVAKYASDGSTLWARSFGTASGADIASAVTTDRDGGVIVTALLQGPVNLGSGLVGPAVMVRYSANGALTWSRTLGRAPRTISATGDHLVVGGSFAAQLDMGCGPLLPRAWADGFLASYSLATGACQWSRAVATSASTFGECGIISLATANDGTIVIGGILRESINLGGGTLTSAGKEDLLLAQFSPTGAYQWSRAFGGSSIDFIRQVKVDSAKNVIVTGFVSTPTDLGGGVRTIRGASDIFLAKYNTTGGHLWSSMYGSVIDDSDVSLGVSASTNEIALSADAGQDIWLGGALLLPTAGYSDLTLARYAP